MYAVGIDVSKGKSTVAIITTNGELINKPFEISHDKKGLDYLYNILNKFKKDDVRILMEATGHYHLPILQYLNDKNFFVCVENALVIKKYCDIDLRKVKNDRKDSIKLANYCSEKWYKLKKFEPSQQTRNQLQFLSRQYTEYIELQTRLKIQLTNLIDKTFPGIKEIINSENRYKLLLEIYDKYPFPDLVLEKSKKEFIEDIDSIAKKLGHRVGVTIGERLYELAPNVILSSNSDDSIKLSISSCVSLLKEIIGVTDNIIEEMDTLAKSLKEYETVSNMKGVGAKTRSRLIAEIGDIRRFKNSNCLVAYCGIDTPPYQSGIFNASNRHITKRGNKYLRKVGYEIIKCVKSSRPKDDNAVYEFIVKKENEGKPKKVAKIAGLNKFLRIYYARVIKLYKNDN